MSTPLMQQYYEIKAKHPGCVLFFRMGDFYELFEEDAIIAAKVLGITLTTRNNGAAGSTPLCGFPYHAAERYIPKMIRAGYRLAICEQLEDPKLAKGIVKRDVVEIITAGTAMSDANLDAKAASFLCAIWSAQKGRLGIAFLDITTGEFRVASGDEAEVESELYRRQPREILWPQGNEWVGRIIAYCESESVLRTELPAEFFAAENAAQVLREHFAADSLDALGLEGKRAELVAAGAALRYAREQKKNSLEHIVRLDVIQLGDYMTLDPATLLNLELLRPMHSEDEGNTLCAVLDETVTAMGGRKLRDWISHPLISVQRIADRQRCVGELHDNPIVLEEIRTRLRAIPDLERLLGRVGSGRANARDIQGVGRALIEASALARTLEPLRGSRFAEIAGQLRWADGRGESLLRVLLDDLPLTVREGNMIRPGTDEELDQLNQSIRSAREWLMGLEARERERLNIPSLKVGFNKVFGYYIEITQQHQHKVPPEYIRKQTLANAERYITPEMKEYETLILNAETRIHAQEYAVFCRLRDEVNGWRVSIQAIADGLAELDVYSSLAYVARRRAYVCPEVTTDDGIDIEQGVHPVITAVNPHMEFIPNDVHLSHQQIRFMLITGPNMAGKSTYLRQTGLIVLMAQIGSFVPARRARVGVVDRIFTRVGASDRLARGLSTFMVEMVETANILRCATPRSLVLLDEIGRGTSTFDGLAIAWAIIEALHDDPARCAKTLFATHYHELTGLIDSLEHAANYQVAVREENGKLLFLHRIISGACDSSYGIHVAEMAGLPADVIRRARKILARLEKHQIDPSDARQAQQKKQKPQLELFSVPDDNTRLLMEELRRVKPEEMTPLQALSLLADWKKQYAEDSSGG